MGRGKGKDKTVRLLTQAARAHPVPTATGGDLVQYPPCSQRGPWGHRRHHWLRGCSLP